MTGRHGVLCGCVVCDDRDLDDELDGKAIARAAEYDDTDPCD